MIDSFQQFRHLDMKVVTHSKGSLVQIDLAPLPRSCCKDHICGSKWYELDVHHLGQPPNSQETSLAATHIELIEILIVRMYLHRYQLLG